MRSDHELRIHDGGVQQFIRNGYLQVNAGLPAAFHQDLCQKLDNVFHEEGNPGNNILPRVPEIHQVFDQPSVRAVLKSILGPGYLMHPHRYCHLNKPGSKGQQWHKDDYIFDQNVRHARCRWVMAFYYPQDVSEDMGPTGLLPGVQHHNLISDNNAAKSTEKAQSLCGAAGTVSIVHFDSWHRATENLSKKNRYMLKFQFTRSQEPAAPAWHCQNRIWDAQADDKYPALYETLWNWISGSIAEAARSNGKRIDQYLERLESEDEGTRLQSAYALGQMGKIAVKPLIEYLKAASEEDALSNTSRSSANPAGGNPSELPAAYALSAAGALAVEDSARLLEEDNWWIRSAAADILGDIGRPSRRARSSLINTLSDSNVWVRRNAAYAIGIIGGFESEDVPALRKALKDEDERIRRNIVFALTKHPAPALQSEPLISDLMELAMNDEGRYVRYYALTALERLSADADRNALWDVMLSSRWCPLTTNKSGF